ncbi:MAG: hypothetical protein NZO16_07095, partial [Deltaproteobacteria bacterium]|nr:hypothetical protein [Deltaproteobacteria bacterium]
MMHQPQYLCPKFKNRVYRVLHRMSKLIRTSVISLSLGVGTLNATAQGAVDFWESPVDKIQRYFDDLAEQRFCDKIPLEPSVVHSFFDPYQAAVYRNRRIRLAHTYDLLFGHRNSPGKAIRAISSCFDALQAAYDELKVSNKVSGKTLLRVERKLNTALSHSKKFIQPEEKFSKLEDSILSALKTFKDAQNMDLNEAHLALLRVARDLTKLYLLLE